MSRDKLHVNCINEVLVGLLHHLVEDQRKSSRWVKNFSHHDEKLTDNDGLVQLAFNDVEILLEESDAFVVNHKDTESVIVTVHQDGERYLETDELGYICELLVLNDDVLVFCEILVVVEEADVD